MKPAEILKDYLNRESKPRVCGRYNSSELYSIIRGDTTPKNFFEKQEIDELGSKYISEGIAIENYLTKVFTEMNVEVECQVKKEIKITDEITLVAKPDFHFGTFIAELKRPARVWEDIPTKWIYQLEAYAQAFQLPVYLWQVSYPLTIKQLRYISSDIRWQKIKKTLQEFHEGVKRSEINNKTKL